MDIIVYRGGTNTAGVPLLEKVTWAQAAVDVDGQPLDPDAVELPQSLEQLGWWLFKTAAGLLSELPMAVQPVRDPFGTIITPGEVATPINPYTAPTAAGVTLLAYADYVTARNDYIATLVAAGEMPGLEPVDPAAPAPLYLAPQVP